MNLLNSILNIIKNKSTPQEIENTRKVLIYDKIIPIIGTDTDGRQKIIKKLLKEDEISLSEDLFQETLLCGCDIKEPEFKSKTKILEVLVDVYYEKSNTYYPCTVGYITNAYQELFDEKLHKNTYYTTTLYVTKENNLYNLDINIKFYKDNN